MLTAARFKFWVFYHIFRFRISLNSRNIFLIQFNSNHCIPLFRPSWKHVIFLQYISDECIFKTLSELHEFLSFDKHYLGPINPWSYKMGLFRDRLFIMMHIWLKRRMMGFGFVLKNVVSRLLFPKQNRLKLPTLWP